MNQPKRSQGDGVEARLAALQAAITELTTLIRTSAAVPPGPPSNGGMWDIVVKIMVAVLTATVIGGTVMVLSHENRLGVAEATHNTRAEAAAARSDVLREIQQHERIEGHGEMTQRVRALEERVRRLEGGR